MSLVGELAGGSVLVYLDQVGGDVCGVEVAVLVTGWVIERGGLVVVDREPVAGRQGLLQRADLRQRAITTTIPEPADQQAHRTRRGSKGGRPPAFDSERYKQRNTVERAINKLKVFRAVATGYDKRAYVFAGAGDVASVRIWLRDPVP